MLFRSTEPCPDIYPRIFTTGGYPARLVLPHVYYLFEDYPYNTFV